MHVIILSQNLQDLGHSIMSATLLPTSKLCLPQLLCHRKPPQNNPLQQFGKHRHQRHHPPGFDNIISRFSSFGNQNHVLTMEPGVVRIYSPPNHVVKLIRPLVPQPPDKRLCNFVNTGRCVTGTQSQSRNNFFFMNMWQRAVNIQKRIIITTGTGRAQLANNQIRNPTM